jgi:hypothetical protein
MTTPSLPFVNHTKLLTQVTSSYVSFYIDNIINHLLFSLVLENRFNILMTTMSQPPMEWIRDRFGAASHIRPVRLAYRTHTTIPFSWNKSVTN